MPSKPPVIVFAKPPRPRRQTTPDARQPTPSVVTAQKPGRSRYRLEISPADPEADAQVKAFLARMIRPLPSN